MGKINIEIKILDGKPRCEFKDEEATLEELAVVMVQLEMLKQVFLKETIKKQDVIFKRFD